jgi:hypothetical protein
MKNIRVTILNSQNIYWLVTVAYFILPAISFGQGIYNESSIQVGGVSIYVDGEIHNSGLLINDGQIAFTNDWESTGSYRGKGSLVANGTSSQKISHFDQQVHSLMMSGWGSKFIKGKINITDELHLLKGVVRVSDKDVLSLDDDVLIFGGSSESHVEGAITVGGTGYKFFPIGKNGIYAPIEFLNVKGTSAKYAVEVFENAPIVTIENTIVKNGLYWQRKDIEGDFGGSAVALQFDPGHFADVNKMILVAGTDWRSSFMTIDNLIHSEEHDQISSPTDVTASIIMLGEVSENWAEADFYLSTALSPNANNVENRKVRIFGERLDDEHFSFEVFNRWGAMVYQNSSLQNMINNGWDGRTKNSDQLPMGAYPYRLLAYDKTGKKFEKKGVISIVY